MPSSDRPLPPLGAHLSVAGGIHKAFTAAESLGMTAVQVFTKNNNRWQGTPLTEEQVSLCRQVWTNGPIVQAVSHASYLINLASPDDTLWEKSIAAMVDELTRADRLGLSWVVVHPGAYTTGTIAEGLARVAGALDRVDNLAGHLAASVCLESTAGQGTCLGADLSHLSAIVGQTRNPDRFGVCLDTCHLLAAGYELSAEGAYERLIHELDATVGTDRVKVWHLNDSRRERGSRVDRHDHLGAGYVGGEVFRRILRDPRWANVPMILETPKGTDADGRDFDLVNLERLKAWAALAGPISGPSPEASTSPTTLFDDAVTCD